MSTEFRLGGHLDGSGVRFALFTTTARQCQVRLFDEAGNPTSTTPLDAWGDGFFGRRIEGLGAGARYKFVLDERELPDPFARFLPDGVHGPALVVASSYEFLNQAPPIRSLAAQVIYELHVGTFTREGTYDAAREQLAYLADLGVTTIELMPLAAFPGQRGWGYDGVALFAPFVAYGEPDALRRFVDEAHRHGLSVLLDVVYNHLGPAGNYLGAYSPRYFTDAYQNAWGATPAFADQPMRRYVHENVHYWLREFRFDGFRLDATHAMFDPSEEHVIRELSRAVREAAPQALLIAEDERNDPGCITELGCNAVWADDFHHQVRVTLTGERDGYYGSYVPGVADLARTIERGWLYEGQTSPVSGRPRGEPADMLPPEAFVYCIQNHDQVGNRALGTRLNHEVSLQAYCLASALLLFLPMTPMLFMGQEWATKSPFLFFTDHEPELGAQVTAGRRREFAAFAAFSEPTQLSAIPDPQHFETFERSKLDWGELNLEPHSRVLRLYRDLLALRRDDPVLNSPCERARLVTRTQAAVLAVRRTSADGQASRLLLANFAPIAVPLSGLAWPIDAAATLWRSGPLNEGMLEAHSALICVAP